MGQYDELRKLRNRLTGIAQERPVAYYVTPEGNDSQDGKSLSAAFKTIEKAFDILNNLDNTRKVVLNIAPGAYEVSEGLLLDIDFVDIIGVNGIGKVYIFASGLSTDLLTIQGRYNHLYGITFFNNSTSYSDLKMFEYAGGQGYGGQNIIEKCYFSPFTEDLTKYGIDIFGGTRNVFRKCLFDGSLNGGIYIKNGFANPVNIIIEDCDFIGTNKGIIIDCKNFNTVIRRNWFTPGSQSGENMVNAIEITANMDEGKVTVYDNHFEQSAANDILDNKTGTAALIEMNNFNGA